MSDTPRNDDSPEFRDPTAPSDSGPSSDASSSSDSESSSDAVWTSDAGSARDHTSPIETDETRPVPPVPPVPSGQSASDSPPAHHPFGAPGSGQPDVSPAAQYPTQGQVHQASQPGPPGYGTPGHPVPPSYGTPGYGTPGHPGPPGYGTPGYGTPGYGTPGYGAPGYAGPAYAAPQSLSGSTIALLVVSGLTTLGCGFGIVALIFAIIAAAKKDQPTEADKFTRWGWIALVVSFVLAVLVIIGFFVLIAVGSTSGSTFDTGY